MPTITSGSEVLPVTASGWTVPSARTRTLSSLLIDVSLRTSDGEMVVLVEVVLVDVLLVELDVEDGTEVAPATVVVGAAVVVVGAVVVVVEVLVLEVVVDDDVVDDDVDEVVAGGSSSSPRWLRMMPPISRAMTTMASPTSA